MKTDKYKSEINDLIESVLSTTPEINYFSFNRYDVICPFCDCESEDGGETMDDIDHGAECAYYQAKQLKVKLTEDE